jgi:hypothetical protein
MQNFRKGVLIEVNSLILYVWFLVYLTTSMNIKLSMSSNKRNVNDNYSVTFNTINATTSYVSRTLSGHLLATKYMKLKLKSLFNDLKVITYWSKHVAV